MKDLHACARLVDKDECVSVLHIETHLIGNEAAQCVEALAHIRRMRIQEEPVGVCQAKHPLSPYRYQLAERLRGDLARQTNSHAIGKDDFADGMRHSHRVHPTSASEDDFPGVVIDAHGKEFSVLARHLLADPGLPIVKMVFFHSNLATKGSTCHIAF